MIYGRDYVAYLCRELIERLTPKYLKLGSPEVVNEKVREAVTNELGAEDKLNDEVRVLLERFADEMRSTGASYPESFKRVKRQLMKERGIVPTNSGEGERISRDKINKLSHVVINLLTNLKKEAELLGERNDVRLEIVRIVTALAREEEKTNQADQPEDSLAKARHPRGQRGMGHSLPQVLRGRDEETGHRLRHRFEVQGPKSKVKQHGAGRVEAYALLCGLAGMSACQNKKRSKAVSDLGPWTLDLDSSRGASALAGRRRS